MAKELAKLFVTIGLDSSEFGKKLNDIQKTATQAGKMMAGIGVGITASLGFAVKAAVDERVNIEQLSTALQNVGVNYDKVKGSLEAVLLATQNKTGVGDDAQREILSRLILVTGDYKKALDLLPTTLDLAAAGQMDTTTAATYLGKAYEELANGADSVSVRFGQASLKFSSMADIQARVAGAAEKMANPLDILKNRFGDLKEAIGTTLLPMLQKLIDKIMPVINNIISWIENNPKLAGTIFTIVAAIGGLMAVLGPLLMMLPLLAAGFTMLLGPVGLVIGAVAAVATGIGFLLNRHKENTEATGKAAEAEKQYAEQLKAEQDELKKTSAKQNELNKNLIEFVSKSDYATSRAAKLGVSVEDIGVYMSEAGRQAEVFRLKWDEVSNDANLMAKALGINLEDVAKKFGKIADKASDLKTKIQEIVDQNAFKLSRAGAFGLSFEDVINYLTNVFGYSIDWITSQLSMLPESMQQNAQTLLSFFGLNASSIADWNTRVNIPVMDTGGIVQGPGVFGVGAGVREIVRYSGESGGQILITGNNFNVRDDADIDRIARSIYRKIQQRS